MINVVLDIFHHIVANQSTYFSISTNHQVTGGAADHTQVACPSCVCGLVGAE